MKQIYVLGKLQTPDDIRDLINTSVGRHPSTVEFNQSVMDEPERMIQLTPAEQLVEGGRQEVSSRDRVNLLIL